MHRLLSVKISKLRKTRTLTNSCMKMFTMQKTSFALRVYTLDVRAEAISHPTTFEKQRRPCPGNVRRGQRSRAGDQRSIACVAARESVSKGRRPRQRI